MRQRLLIIRPGNPIGNISFGRPILLALTILIHALLLPFSSVAYWKIFKKFSGLFGLFHIVR
jgi:hypothetical protein